MNDCTCEDVTYGYYRGGDPRLFMPDLECCEPEEIERHRVACDAWARGERPDPGGPHIPIGENMGGGIGTHGWRTVSHYGIGTTCLTPERDCPVHGWTA